MYWSLQNSPDGCVLDYEHDNEPARQRDRRVSCRIARALRRRFLVRFVHHGATFGPYAWTTSEFDKEIKSRQSQKQHDQGRDQPNV